MIRRAILGILGVLFALMVMPSVQGDSLFLLHAEEPEILIAGWFGSKPLPPVVTSQHPKNTSPYALNVADGFPAWFWDPPKEPTAVGYSPMYRESPTANDSAFKDAALRLFMDKRARVSGGTAISETVWGTRNEGNSIDYQLDESDWAMFDNFLTSVVRLDSCIVPSLGVGKAMRIILVGTAEIQVDRSIVPTPKDIDAPQGLTDAVGSAIPYFYASSSWQEAERISRVQLAQNSASVQGLTTVETYDSRTSTQSTVTARTVNTDVNVILSNVRVVKRRFDPSTGAHRVWVVGQVSLNR